MDRCFIFLVMLMLIVTVVGFEGLDELALALYNLFRLCYTTSAWGKVVLFVCGVLTVVLFAVEE